MLGPRSERLVIIKGAGDLATGVGHRLWRAGFPLLHTEVPEPTVVRRTVSFAEAVFEGETLVEGVRAEAIREGNPGSQAQRALELIAGGTVPVLVDPEARVVGELKPWALVDAIMAKRNLGTHITDAEVVIALGPGFEAGVDVHAVIETQRGHDLGRVITEDGATPNTGVPGEVMGFSKERLLRAPSGGVFRPLKSIGDRVEAGEAVAEVGGVPLRAEISGVLRGLLRGGIRVSEGFKVGDIDPRGSREHCFTISDKARAVGGGVLEALMMFLNKAPVRVPGSLGREQS
ncbi:MAG: selenium-dependent molybdenum cofactor biosynthesis protein YqeB [Nitrospinota bacterium]